MTWLADLRAVHHEQLFSNSCLAACATMVRIRTGLLALAEASTHERALMIRLGASPKGLIPDDVASELGSRLIKANPDDPNNILIIRADIESRRWWHIAMLHPGPLNDRVEQQRPQPTSRHGLLDAPLPHHAVVLAGYEAAAFLCLDPWYPEGFQPQTIPLNDFARLWTGRYIPVCIA